MAIDQFQLHMFLALLESVRAVLPVDWVANPSSYVTDLYGSRQIRSLEMVLYRMGHDRQDSPGQDRFSLVLNGSTVGWIPGLVWSQRLAIIAHQEVVDLSDPDGLGIVQRRVLAIIELLRE